jgi:aminopeptidase
MMDKDSELFEGARNAVRVCMNVKASDRVFILTDDETVTVGKALEHEAKAVQAEVECVRLEEFGRRPMTHLPEELGRQMVSFAPSVTFLATTIKGGELPMRNGFVGVALGEVGTRHAHMIGVTPQIMREGMRADYKKVYNLTMQVYEKIRQAKAVHVTSPEGTDLIARFDEKLKWVPLGGLYHKAPVFGNLPEGEVFTSPAFIEGVIAGRVLGDHFSTKYGVLTHPVMIEIENSFAQKIQCEQKDVEAELTGYLDSSKNGRRVGEFAVGTNIGVTALCGVMLQDEKIPGIHIAFGSPLGHFTGADWESDTHVDVVPTGCTIEVDGELMMQDGRFTSLG